MCRECQRRSPHGVSAGLSRYSVFEIRMLPTVIEVVHGAAQVEDGAAGAERLQQLVPHAALGVEPHRAEDALVGAAAVVIVPRRDEAGVSFSVSSIALTLSA